MPTILCKDIEARVALLLQDIAHTRWTQTELRGWLSDAQRAVCVVRPNAYVKVTSIALVAGTKQAIPADAAELGRVNRNMGTGGSTPGRAVTYVDMDAMDLETPNWHAATANAIVQNYLYDIRNPRNFYVYPPQPASAQGQVEIMCPSIPPELAMGDDVTILLDDHYQPALIDFIAARCYAKDKENLRNQNASTAHMQSFISLVTGGAVTQKDANASANVNTGKP